MDTSKRRRTHPCWAGTGCTIEVTAAAGDIDRLSVRDRSLTGVTPCDEPVAGSEGRAGHRARSRAARAVTLAVPFPRYWFTASPSDLEMRTPLTIADDSKRKDPVAPVPTGRRRTARGPSGL
jgi:hypothetical protein